MRIVVIALFITLTATLGFSQTEPSPSPKAAPAPTLTPAPARRADATPGSLPPTDDKKINVRPAERTPEPYDKATVAEMASKCISLDTEAGGIEFELFPESAPETVRNFLDLTALGLMDTTTFQRVVPGFVIQGGSLWTREGGITKAVADRARRTVPDEPNKILHVRGIVSLARGEDANTGTSNFFILVSSGEHLDGKFAAFGRVTKGMDVVDAINKMPVTDEKPDKPVRIKKAGIIACTSEPPA